ncbi:hypothetical protein ABEB36_006810 [Hypothenemus hampei]|uniref:Uncharacterized protein n=1 Tax=Hypothenemus hampei TaxID=57062 RepID=A0ABD1ESB9_HYPHA
MFRSNDNYSSDDYGRQAVVEGTRALERTGESLSRAYQIAVETENIGSEVVSELNDQRETLLRTRDRLEGANHELNRTRSIITKMGRNAAYNKFLLIIIIIFEALILGLLTYMKFFKSKH